MKVLCAAERTCPGCPVSNAEDGVRVAVEASVDNQFAQYAWKSLAQLSIPEAISWAQTIRQEINEDCIGDTAIAHHVLDVISRIADGECVNYPLSNHIKQ